MEKMSKFRELLSEGCIGAFYTLTGYFCKVYPVLLIDKVKFSFAEKGKNGEGFDVYVDFLRFLMLSRDILSGRMLKLLEADTGDYPAAWNYVTGENGSKELHIGRGRNGVVIQGRDKTEKGRNAFVAVSYESLRVMAELFLMVTGLIPVTGYWKDMKDLCLAGIEKNASFHREAQENVRQLPDKDKKSETSRKLQTVDFRTAGGFLPLDTEANMEKSEDDRIMKVAATDLGNDAPSEILFYKAQRSKTGDWYGRLVEAASQKPVRLRIVVAPCGERNGKAQFVFMKQAS